MAAAKRGRPKLPDDKRKMPEEGTDQTVALFATPRGALMLAEGFTNPLSHDLLVVSSVRAPGSENCLDNNPPEAQHCTAVDLSRSTLPIGAAVDANEADFPLDRVKICPHVWFHRDNLERGRCNACATGGEPDYE